MGRKAVCIGIDDYRGGDNDLHGCVNDARAWADLLAGRFGFARGDVRTLRNGEATRRGILAALEGLVAGARRGDVCAFIYSGHGTWIPDRGARDEADGRDEALVPWEEDFGKLITDDELRPVLDRVPGGVAFTFIADSCYSGTVTRLIPGGPTGAGKVRFLPPPEAIAGRMTARAPVKKKLRGIGEERMPEIFLSAASDNEPASEGDFAGVTRGAFSYFAVRELEASGPGISYEALIARVRRSLAGAGYTQRPQLEGPAGAKRRAVFSPC
jgi:hypothetical protein